MSPIASLFSSPTNDARLVQPARPGEPAHLAAIRLVRREWLVQRSRRSPGRAARLRAAASGHGLRGRVSTGLRGGAVVLDHGCASPFESVLRAAGIHHVRAVLVSSSGSVVVRGDRADGGAILRIGSERREDASHAYAALEAFADDPLVPAPLGFGLVDGWHWTAEAELPGRRPASVDDALVDDVVAMLSSWPLHAGPPAIDDDVHTLASAVPKARNRLDAITPGLVTRLAALPSTVRHGDLWHGNLLVDAKGRLAGVVDWDGWSPNGVPGTDLLHLLSTAHRRSIGLSFGEYWTRRPWTCEPAAPALSRLLTALGVATGPADVTDIAIAWWLGQVSGDVTRDPSLASDDRWVARNVIEPLDLMSRW